MKVTNTQRLLDLSSNGHISAKYQKIDTLTIVEQLGLDVNTARLNTSAESTKHHLTFDLKDLPQTYIGGDLVSPTLHLFNSYNADGALMIAFGLLRAVCANGLIAGTSIFNARAIHVKGPKIEYLMASFADQIKTALQEENIERYYTQIDELDRVRCNRTDIERILDDMKLPARAYNDSLYRFENPRREADIGSSAWLAYNRVQEVIAHHKRGDRGISDNKKLMQVFLDNTVKKQVKFYPKLKAV